MVEFKLELRVFVGMGAQMDVPTILINRLSWKRLISRTLVATTSRARPQPSGLAGEATTVPESAAAIRA